MADISAEDEPERRLAAILAADIAGYSRLMGGDEVATVHDLKAHQAVVLPMVARFGGTIIDTAGDGILAQFPSAVRAVECAVAIQKIMGERNFDVAEDRRMQFRIGVNLGDILHDGTRFYGDGINIAARLEAIAEPGGICLSAQVRDAIFGKLGLPLRDLGNKSLKNISRPVQAYRVQLDGVPDRRWWWPGSLRRYAIPLVAALVLSALAGGVFWDLSLRFSPTKATSGAALIGSGIAQLRLRFEETHDRLSPCCDRNIITTHELTVSFSGNADIHERQHTSNSGQFAKTTDADFVIGVTTGHITWKSVEPGELQRIGDYLQNVVVLTIKIRPDNTCTLDVTYTLKSGFTDTVGIRAGTDELGHFTLPKPINAACTVG